MGVSKAAQITLRIEALELEGFDPRYKGRIAAALESELGGLLREQGLPEAFQASLGVESLSVSPIQVSANSRPEEIGRQAARAIYRQFTETAFASTDSVATDIASGASFEGMER